MTYQKVEKTWCIGKGRVPTNISIDRVIPGKEYSEENIRLTCYIVNTMRSDLSDEALKFWCESIARNL